MAEHSNHKRGRARRQPEDAPMTAQLEATALELAHAEAHERQRIAAMLHDDLQQLLAAAQFKLAVFAEAPDHEDLQGVVREVAGILDEVIAQTRWLATELGPPVPPKDGLVPALEWPGRWMQQKHGLTIRLKAGDQGTRLMPLNAVRGLPFNVTKHAKVTAASVPERGCRSTLRAPLAGPPPAGRFEWHGPGSGRPGPLEIVDGHTLQG